VITSGKNILTVKEKVIGSNPARSRILENEINKINKMICLSSSDQGGGVSIQYVYSTFVPSGT
jgi:hypothetical protein